MNATYTPSSRSALEPVQDELELVYLSQQGDREMFARLYVAYTDRIFRYVYYRVTDRDLAQDITSHVFLKAWEKLGTYRAGQSPFTAWLYRIAHNAVIDYYRTYKVSIGLEEADAVVVSHADEVDERLDLQFKSHKLRAALGELTEEQQQVLILRFVSGLSTLQIAQQLGKRQGAVRALQLRGLKGLAKSPALQTEQTIDQ
ncbi:MAG TPA: sigma-70 family RNA polymerase sigma factor [Anaerolineales bacterium]